MIERHFDKEDRLVRLANRLCAYYGHPVYLIGSALKKEHPGDWDLVCILPDDEFKARYGYYYPGCDTACFLEKLSAQIDGFPTEEYWRWADENKKRTIDACKYTRKIIDFKTFPESYAAKVLKDAPRFRMDNRENFFK